MLHLTKAEEQCIEKNNLEPNVKMLYIYLRDRCFYDKVSCFPSQKDLAEKMKRSARSIRRYLTVLCECGLIEKNQRGFNQSNEYILPLKSFGQTVDGTVKKCKKSKSVGCGQVRPPKPSNIYIENIYISDDYTPVMDIIDSCKQEYGEDVVGIAMDKIKGRNISFKGFATYFKKVIVTVLGFLENKAKYEAIKRNFKIMKQFISSNKNKPKGTFNNFEQRNYNFEYLEAILTGHEVPEDSTLYCDTPKIKPKDMSAKNGTFNNFEQRTYDFNELEKMLLGW